MTITDHAQIDWDEHGNPHSRVFADVYFSTESGLDETRHVFLIQNELAERFAACPGSVGHWGNRVWHRA
jgi:tRNA 5-methylaminomethyl-2-thiouridine biosynthesis bifunctional protein